MKQILEGLASFKTKITDLLHPEATNSFNKTEVHFYGPVNFIGKQSKGIKRKIDSSLTAKETNELG
ncbi:MAG: hypothetical protein UT12_C0002G0011 [Candidatus Curtissbacteria bacterium GW2011_GWC2_38_9]|uniref:Uncharacterized protein n=3 Tax=Candidatus Curtissiibacteriota TaxID=1752717 RepID=A0A1F5HRE5_9BACT|nr:MAG: hypothetical protein UT12_C0002G0011 [Candidatus Curtissbacteria bacterium GW2011_GWC2_38_9]KKS04608.1 MAG: hypothetical protein UU56_C0004G0009 [Candidatus Curtissbacteria bacterium GW2011_GWA2_41_24]OGE06734.1 MAG: hypothetical protein A2W70_04770 [Candidatus Curtissbacteria bacterium RIFCSPLOWO2_02_41_11]